MVARILVVMLVAGCGRVGFEESSRSYLFEDGFEDTLDPWSPLSDVLVDTGPPAPVEGARSLRAQAGTSASARAEVRLPRAVTSGAFFVRSYIYLPSGYAISDLSFIEITQARFSNLIIMTVPELGYWSTLANDGEASNFVLPRDEWMCIEARVGVADAPNGTLDMWVDGTLRYSVAGLDTFDGGIDELHVGVTWAGGGQAPSLIYVDDVVADDVAPIGCN